MHIMFTVEQGTAAGDIQEWCPEHCNTETLPSYINIINHPQNTFFFTFLFVPTGFRISEERLFYLDIVAMIGLETLGREKISKGILNIRKFVDTFPLHISTHILLVVTFKTF